MRVLGQSLARLGYPLDIRRPRFGDPLPKTMAGHAGAIIEGGSGTAADKVAALEAVGCQKVVFSLRPPYRAEIVEPLGRALAELM